MKKFFAVLLALAMVLSLVACGTATDVVTEAPSEATEENIGGGVTEPAATEAAEDTTALKVAMVTDYGDITDESFNQATYEGAKEWCEANGCEFSYYKPAGDSTAERVAMIEKAIEEGYNTIIMPGYAFGEAIAETAGDNPDVYFIALDVSASDLGDGYEMPANLYCAVYQEEIAGFLAGWAAVQLGYTKLGFLGGMAVPAVVRYGYGFVQGADFAASIGEGKEISIKYAYGNQFFGDADITAAMDTWYADGTEVVFACGGGIYTSAAEAAAKVGGKVIGVDVDQAATIDGAYGEGMTVTSAMKGLAATVKSTLTDLAAGNWANYSGQVATLGLVSGTNPEENFVQLPDSTQFADSFTKEDYTALVGQLFDGTIVVDNSTEAMPATTHVTVEDLGNIK